MKASQLLEILKKLPAGVEAEIHARYSQSGQCAELLLSWRHNEYRGYTVLEETRVVTACNPWLPEQQEQ